MRVTSKTAVGLIVLLSATVLTPQAHAEGYSWLRSENKHVLDGNEKLGAGDGKAALGAYDLAARELPSEGGVHLNRGLALMKTGDTAAARTALKLATQPPASANVRADAYYNLGIGFYKDADAHATKAEHDEAQKLFREASDSFKQSLRLRPGDRNTAWNYELGARRVREQQEKQKQKEQQDKDKQNKDEQNKDGKDQQSSDDKQDDKGDQKQDPQDGKKQDKPEDKQAQKDKQAEKDKQAQKDKPQDEEQKQQQTPEKLRPDVAEALDALQDGEQNLERLRAMQRASSERRSPEKDW